MITLSSIIQALYELRSLSIASFDAMNYKQLDVCFEVV
jgi:hypothetical protein